MPLESSDGLFTPFASSTPPDLLNVLVVDDETDICLLLATALEATGSYSVTAATGADSALQAVSHAKTPFHGIFVDIQMPGTSGIELCRVLRATPGYLDTPIIMLTAMVDWHYLKDAFSEGASDYITKPFDLDDIRNRFASERTKSQRRGLMERDVERAVVPARGLSLPKIRLLGDAIPFRDVRRCLCRDAFHSYITHFKARFDDPLFIRTITLERASDLFSSLPDGGFQALIQHMAEAISTVTEHDQELFTYYGNGVFFAASETTNTISQSALNAALRAGDVFQKIEDLGHSLAVVVGKEDALTSASKPV